MSELNEVVVAGSQQVSKVDVVNNGVESFFGSIANFEVGQRMAKMIASSDMVPAEYKNNIGNCVIALEISNRIGMHFLSVMQSLYIVHGKPAWSSQFLIAGINSCGKFEPLNYEYSGKDDDYGCIAYSRNKQGERLNSPRVSIAMAKAEGWFAKAGSKWKTMPEMMLRYRAATFFARCFAPEIAMGMTTREEIEDVINVVDEPVKKSKFEKTSAGNSLLSVKPVIQDAVIEEPAMVKAETVVSPEQSEISKAIAGNYAGITVEQFKAYMAENNITLRDAIANKDNIIGILADKIPL